MEKLRGMWIQPSIDMKDICPVFKKTWVNKSGIGIQKAELVLTALGVYEAEVNGKRVGDYVLAPGWTAYEKRLQYQVYDITAMLEEHNELQVTVGKGWFRSPIPGWENSESKKNRMERPCGILGEVRIVYADGNEKVVATDESWLCAPSAIKFSEIYDGETYDSNCVPKYWERVSLLDWEKDILIPQEGEKICEMESVEAKSIFTTPSGEVVVDFGQEVTGYVEFTVNAEKGERVKILHGEMLDSKGNFYNDNYRNAKAEINYICKQGIQTWHPHLTFFGFRYIKLEEFPGKPEKEDFKAIVVYSEIHRTGNVKCSDTMLNQLFSNVFWGQKGNFLDIPTDCPQRDERLGWTGDAQVFVKTASYNFDVEKFFSKWLHDLSADQRVDGSVGQVIPDYMPEANPSAAWGDAAVICPWQIYLSYGNKQILSDQFESMKKWVDYITFVTQDKYLWTGGEHFGDWLGLDAPSGSYKGATREDFIASAFYAYSVKILIKAGQVLGQDMQEYVRLFADIKNKFGETYPVYETQTEHVLAVHFGLTENPQKTVDALAKMIEEDGCKIQTGFVGTPYILHVLSDYGYEELAYTLLLRKEYPSWLYSVGKGATTIWEHWDGIMENGNFWSEDMNSFNHYAYGSVLDWVYEKAAGIQLIEEYPGFEKIKIAPKADRRLEWLEASIDTRNGKIESRWTIKDDVIKYEISTAVPAQIMIDKKIYDVEPGNYILWGVVGKV